MSRNLRSLYVASFKEFLNSDSAFIFGILCSNYHGDALTSQREAWIYEIDLLKNVLSSYNNDDNSQIIFEYDIPRLSKRIDIVLLLNGIIFVLEFKVGQENILENDIDQVFDYALDLNNFHKLSQNKIIVPILIATKSDRCSNKIMKSCIVMK